MITMAATETRNLISFPAPPCTPLVSSMSPMRDCSLAKHAALLYVHFPFHANADDSLLFTRVPLHECELCPVVRSRSTE